ncbi:hypothetical protein ABH935_009537 [Catenulispora sp. GAS73]|uniref:hypothetical protein n=1 Tax=Catenulispora sp. GAS73 TaxID=3156269 RepID=UPI003515780C
MIGKDQYGNQAVVCVKLTVIIVGGPGAALPYGVNAQAVLLCENSSNVKVQCANISERVQMADAQNGVDVTQNNICGHAYGACPVTGLSAQTGTMDYTSIEPLYLHIHDTADAIVLTMCADTHYLAPAAIEGLARDMETVAVAAALDPAVPVAMTPASRS